MSQSFPVAEVLNGTYKNVGFDETKEWSAILLGMAANELCCRSDNLSNTYGDKFRQSPDYTAWLVDADNFLEFMMANYQPDVVVMISRELIAEQRLPFAPDRMEFFNTLANTYAKIVSAA